MTRKKRKKHKVKKERNEGDREKRGEYLDLKISQKAKKQKYKLFAILKKPQR